MRYGELKEFIGYDCLVFFVGLDGSVYDATGCVVSLVHNWLTLAHRQDGVQIDLPAGHILHIEETTDEK
ncbi:hypothetical protein ES703_41670 [subsurface metagenome]